MSLKKDYLIIIDVQNDFVTGSLATESAKNIGKNILKYIIENNFKKIIFTRDTHFKDYAYTQEGSKLPIKHCIYGTFGWSIVDDLREISKKSTIINKFSFGYIKWKSKIKNPDSITICGLISDVCVISNALILKAIYPETKIRIIESLCFGSNEKMHNCAMSIAKACQIEVVY